MKHFFFFIIAFIYVIAQAQVSPNISYYLPQNITYDVNIPKPENVFGFEVGKRHISHDKLVEYLKILCNASNRITLEERGMTFEGRPLILLKITSPENHKNIENIRKDHLKLSDAKISRQIATESMPLVVYQGFSIHRDEPSGANASILLAYYLAAAQGSEIEELLKNTVILLDPCLNPDGFQRFSHWANSNQSENINTDPNDREFNEAWPSGRYNHYWFDMNRDWLSVQLPESKARIETFQNWLPNILTDHHEMASNATFFFQPGVQSRVHPLTPNQNQILTKKIGNYHAEALNKIGSLYFTEERFDDYYFGKGSTYPDINGTIGILFEQAGSQGNAQEIVNGVLTFPFTIRNQFTTALSTLKAAKEMRVELLNYQREFYLNVQKENLKNPVKAIVFGDEKDLAKTFHLAEILKRHHINFYKLKNDQTLKGINFKKESSFIVPTDQKNSTLIKAMFEKRTTFTDSLFYDISAWTFPMAFNLDYSDLDTTGNIGDIVTNVELKKGEVSTKSSYAYLMEWNEYYTPKALNKLLKKGINAKVGMKPFSIDGIKYDYGTILISVQNQPMDENELYTILKETAENSNVNFVGVSTGLTVGIDLGSSLFRAIETPTVALIVGNGVSSTDAGEIWHLFDHRYQMNITKLEVENLNRINLFKYSSIIIPSSTLNLNEQALSNLKNWVQNGGVLIGYEDTVKCLAKSNLIGLEFLEPKVDAKTVTFEQKDDFRGAQMIVGAIFETKLDRSHPINFGFKSDKLPMFRASKIFIKPDSQSFNNPIKYTENPLLSGYISNTNLEIMKNSVPFQVKSLDRGKIIVFTDNTNFRGFWFGTNKLLMNAIFFAKSM